MNEPLGIVILAAGKGKRLGGQKQKTIQKLQNKSLLHYLFDTILQLHPEKIVVVVGHKKEDVIEELKGFPVIFVEQTELAGTGNAVLITRLAFENFSGTILVMCGDTPFLSTETLRNLRTTHINSNASCTILTAKVEEPKGYGRIARNDLGGIVRIVEELNATEKEREINEINTGVYLFKAQDLFFFLPQIERNPLKQEYYLTDIVELMSNAGKTITTCITSSPEETLGINTLEDLQKAETYLRKKKAVNP
ncbi:MAG: NTP transferase domain-containing protein [Candidatus Ratteibacteria bacterium]